MASLRNIRLLLAFLVVSLAIGIVFTVSKNSSKPASKEAVSQKELPLNVDLALQKARFTEVRGGITIWTIVAERAEYSKKGEIVQLFDVNMTFSKNRRAGNIYVTADRGTYSTKTKNVTLRGKVHMTSESGIVFDTNTLDYLASLSRFKTADVVTFRQKRMRLVAQGMELDVAGQIAHFSNAVNATVSGL